MLKLCCCFPRNSAHDGLDMWNALSTVLPTGSEIAVRCQSDSSLCRRRMITSTSTFRMTKRSRSSQPANVHGWTQRSRTGDSQRDAPADLSRTADRARTTLCACATLPLSSELQRRDARCGNSMGFGVHAGYADSGGGGPAARRRRRGRVLQGAAQTLVSHSWCSCNPCVTARQTPGS